MEDQKISILKANRLRSRDILDKEEEDEIGRPQLKGGRGQDRKIRIEKLGGEFRKRRGYYSWSL